MTVYESKIVGRASLEERRDLAMQRTVNELLSEWRKTPKESLGSVITRILSGKSPEEIEQAIITLKEAQRQAEETARKLKKKAREDACTHAVICMDWEESEEGWGIRPDGWSVHKTEDDCKRYVKEYWDGMPSRGPNGEVPYEYSREGSKPYVALVNDHIFELLEDNAKRGKAGVRIFSSEDAPVKPSKELLLKMLQK